MKLRAKLLFIALFLLLLQEVIIGQNLHQINQLFFNAYATNSIPAWNTAFHEIENATNEDMQLVLAKGYFGAAGTAIGNQEKDLAEELLDKATKLAKKLNNQGSKTAAQANALLSTAYGMKISLSPFKGVLLGSKSQRAASKGIELAPEDGFTNYAMGSNLFYTPSKYGGDIERSVTFLEKAKAIYESKQQTYSWEYLNTMALLGQAYHNLKKYDDAIDTYHKALSIAPDFDYIKKYLLPRTESQKSK